MELSDVYVAIEKAKAREKINFFIEKYLGSFYPLQDIFEYPQYYDTEKEFETTDYKEMISYVLNRGDGYFHFYFRNLDNQETPMAMIFMNTDGSVFLGLGTHYEYTSEYEKILENDFNSLILVCYNVIPPNNIKDFKENALR